MKLTRFSRTCATLNQFLNESHKRCEGAGTDRVLIFSGELNNGFIAQECEKLKALASEDALKAVIGDNKLQVVYECGEDYHYDDFKNDVENSDLPYQVFSTYCCVLNRFGEGVGDYDVTHHLEFDVLYDIEEAKAVAVRAYLEISAGVKFENGIDDYTITDRYDNPFHEKPEAIQALIGKLSDHIQHFATLSVNVSEGKPLALEMAARDCYHKYSV